MRVTYALILREIKSRFGEQRLGYLWALVEPILYIVILASLYSLRGSHAVHGMGLSLFLVTGFSSFFLFRNLMTACSRALSANKQLLTYPQVQFFDIILARVLLEFATSILNFIIIVSGIYLMGIDSVNIPSPLGVLAGFVMMALFGIGLGLVFSSVFPIFPSIQPLSEALLGRPLFFTSGVFFSADMIPEPARGYMLLNPLFQVIEYIRGSFFAGVDTSNFNPEYCIGFLVVLLFMGLLMQRALYQYTLRALSAS